MGNGGIRDIIIQVISSWQVIVATVVILIYISLVRYVSSDKRRRRPAMPKVAKGEKEKVVKEKKPKKAKKKGKEEGEEAEDDEIQIEE